MLPLAVGQDMPPRSRRALLRSLGAAALGGLAGCTISRTESTDATTATPTSTRERTLTSTPSSPPSATETDTETATSDPRPCGPAWPTTSGWPLSERTPAGSSYAPDGARFDDPPGVAWSVAPEPAPGLEEFQPEFATPVAVGDALYVAKPTTHGANQRPPERHFVEARAAATGSLRWSFELSRAPVGPVVWAGSVLVAGGDTVHALAPDAGEDAWRVQFADDVNAVVPARGRVLVLTDESVHGLAPDGAMEWSVPLAATATTGLATVRWRFYLGLHDGTVECRDARSGDRHWTATTHREGWRNDDAPGVDSVTATACAVYAVTDGDVYAFGRDGQFQWHAGENVWAVATDGGTVYVGTGDGRLRAIDAGSGETEWEAFHGVENPRIVDGVVTPPVVTDDALYVFARNDTLVALSTDDGTERWTTERRTADLALAGGTLYGTGYDEGSIVAMR